MRCMLLFAAVLLVGCGGRSAYTGPLAQSGAARNGGPAYVGVPLTLGFDLENSSGDTLVLDKVELLHVQGPLEVVRAFAAHTIAGSSYLSSQFPPPPYPRSALRPLRGFVVPPRDRAADEVFVEVRLTERIPASAGGVRLSYHSRFRGYQDDLDADYSLTPVARVPCGQNSACRWNRTVTGWVHDGLIARKLVPAARAFVADGCADCHRYRNIGATNLHAPDLTFGGPHRLSTARLVAELRCPSCAQPGSAMPSFRRLPVGELQRIAAFLVASR